MGTIIGRCSWWLLLVFSLFNMLRLIMLSRKYISAGSISGFTPICFDVFVIWYQISEATRFGAKALGCNCDVGICTKLSVSSVFSKCCNVGCWIQWHSTKVLLLLPMKLDRVIEASTVRLSLSWLVIVENLRQMLGGHYLFGSFRYKVWVLQHNPVQGSIVVIYHECRCVPVCSTALLKFVPL